MKEKEPKKGKKQTIETPHGVVTFIKEKKAEGVPLIAERTSQQVLEVFGIHEIESEYDDWENNEYITGEEIAMDTFSYLSTNDMTTYDSLSEWLTNNYDEFEDGEMRLDAATIGISFVFYAFATQFGPRFYDRLREVPILQKQNALRQEIGGTIISKINNKRQIPGFQIYLNGALNSYTEYMDYGPDMKEGAVAAYKMIDKCWNSLNLNQTKKR